MVEANIVLTLLQTISIMVGIGYYIISLNNSQKTRNADVLYRRIALIDEDFYGKWLNFIRQDWTTIEEWIKYRQENPGAHEFYAYMALSFSSIGALLKRGIVDEKVFFEVFTPSIIIWTWEKMQPIVSFRRETMNFSIYSGFEYMAKKAKEHYPEIRSIKDYEKQVISKVKTKP